MKTVFHVKMKGYMQEDDIARQIAEAVPEGNQLILMGDAMNGRDLASYIHRPLQAFGVQSSRFLKDDRLGLHYIELRKGSLKSRLWTRNLSWNALRNAKPYMAAQDARIVHTWIDNPSVLMRNGAMTVMPVPQEMSEFHFHVLHTLTNGIGPTEMKIFDMFSKWSDEVVFDYRDNPFTYEQRCDAMKEKHKYYFEQYTFENGDESLCRKCDMNPNIGLPNINESHDFMKFEKFFLSGITYCKPDGHFRVCNWFGRKDDGELDLFCTKQCPYYAEQFMAGLKKEGGVE